MCEDKQNNSLFLKFALIQSLINNIKNSQFFISILYFIQKYFMTPCSTIIE